MTKHGVWWFKSKSKPEWNISGEGYVNALFVCQEAKTKLEELKEKLGESPEDLTYGFMKD